MYFALTDAGAQRSEGDGAWNQGSEVWGRILLAHFTTACQEAAPVRLAEPEETAPPQAAGPTPPANGPQLPVPSPRERSKSPRTPRQRENFWEDFLGRWWGCFDANPYEVKGGGSWSWLKLVWLCRTSIQWTWKLQCFCWEIYWMVWKKVMSMQTCFNPAMIWAQRLPGSCASLGAVRCASRLVTMSGTTDFQLIFDPNLQDLLVDFWCHLGTFQMLSPIK